MRSHSVLVVHLHGKSFHSLRKIILTAFFSSVASPPSTTPTTEASTGTKQGPDTGARSSGLTDAEMWGIIGGCIAFAIVVIIILIVCICKKKKAGGATKGKANIVNHAVHLI